MSASTTSLPTYAVAVPTLIPPYSAEPQPYEQRLALNRLRTRPSGDFVKQSGGVRLRLIEQEDNVSLPVYGCGDCVQGSVSLSKPESITNIDVKIEGSLRLKEVAEGGTASQKLCLSAVNLYSRDANPSPCPASLSFSLALPTTFTDHKDSYPLPPSHEAHLSGVPGFCANIHYTVSVVVQKNKAASLLRLGNNTVSTPFRYYPRSRPAVPLPGPLRNAPIHASECSDWRPFESVVPCKTDSEMDIVSRLYLPSSRVFCMTQSIPFYLIFTSSAMSLASFLPFGPSAIGSSPSHQRTHIQLVRQTTVDVRNALILGTKTDIWRVDVIGEGRFEHAGDGADWIAFSGEITISKEVSICGFKAAGFTVKDCIVLSMRPAEPTKAPFGELRQIVPVRLTTDGWTGDGSGPRFGPCASVRPEEGLVDGFLRECS